MVGNINYHDDSSTNIPFDKFRNWNFMHHQLISGNSFGLGGKMREKHAEALLSEAHNNIMQYQIKQKQIILQKSKPTKKRIPTRDEIKKMTKRQLNALIDSIRGLPKANNCEEMKNTLLCHYYPQQNNSSI